ncbi:MAG: hypothetical protein P4L73_03485 [Caulobacteraceae bacterium]|nr:hypothetical protein [Caulobacteraceae bacterium]
MAQHQTRSKGAAAPIIGRCRFCAAPFTSRYAAKTHECRTPAEPEREQVA